MTTRLVLVTLCLVAMATLVAPQCGSYPNPTKKKSLDITPSLKLEEGAGLIGGIGVFALLAALLFIFIRRVVYRDTHLLDTFFDAGGDNNFAVVACSVVSKSVWITLYLPIAGTVYLTGIVGQFWLAAVFSAHHFLFAIVASEFRSKAPGAKTFLQVIRCRCGTSAHIIVMFFAVLVNLFLIALVLTRGTEVLSALTTGLGDEVILLLLALAASVFTIVGGVGGGLYMAYFACVGILVIVLMYFFGAFYMMGDSTTHNWGFAFNDRPVLDSVCDIIQCGQTGSGAGNLDNSLLTFSSMKGFLFGVCCILTGFSYLFVNQATWTSASIAKPRHAVWGFLTAGVSFFAIPFTFSFTFGMANWVTAVLEGEKPVTGPQATGGMIPVVMSQLTLGQTGDVMMSAFTTLVVIMAVSAQIHSLTQIFIYDIYLTYINRFRSASKSGSDQEMSQYLWYNQRNVNVRHAATVLFSILSYPAAMVFMSIEVVYAYKVLLVAVVVASSVLPVCLAVIWHRTTGWGVVSGVLAGLMAGVGAWLLYASTFSGGLEDFVRNTTHQPVMITFIATSFVAGGIICILVSLCCGGLNRDRTEEQEWDNKCFKLDNPAKPWAVQYVVSSQTGDHVETPTYKQVRYQNKSAEVSAYILGTVLTVLIVMVWPALMLLVGVFSCSAFTIWAMLVVVLAVISALYLGLVPLIAEIVQLCMAPPLPTPRQQQEQQQQQQPPQPQPLLAVKHDAAQPYQEADGVVVTSHALATEADMIPAPVKFVPVIPDDDDSSIVDNSDGLNVLSDPRAPAPAGARKQPATQAPSKTTTSSEPALYPLSSSTSLQPYSTSCVPYSQMYNISAADIPLNGGSSGQISSTIAGFSRPTCKTHVRLE